MSQNSVVQPSNEGHDEQKRRCPKCDSVVDVQATTCLLCGATLTKVSTESSFDDGEASHDDLSLTDLREIALPGGADVALERSDLEYKADKPSEPVNQFDSPLSPPVEDSILRLSGSEKPAQFMEGGPFEAVLEERESPVATLILGVLIIFIISIAFLLLRGPDDLTLALLPTPTAITQPPTLTPTWTPLPTETQLPTETPTITPTQPPTPTLQPPRSHSVTSGESLFNLSLRYGVTMDSILQLNNIPSDGGIQVGQQLLVPWPTPTPPLEVVAVEINGEMIIADPTNCRMYEIKGGDTFFGLSARERLPLDAILAVNRLTLQSVMQPGDSICLPEIIRGGVLPPTPGPSPTATATEPPEGPMLVYPGDGTTIDPTDDRFFLQWVAVKDLTEDEWYMVELTDLSDYDSHPLRAFTRQTSFQVPSSWRPDESEVHQLRWRVRVVQVTGEREDGSFIYTFGGNNSEEEYFFWLGAVPTPTPTPTPVPTSTPVS